jgi:hypothetical protein
MSGALVTVIAVKKSLARFLAQCHLFITAMKKATTILSFRSEISRRVFAFIGLALFVTVVVFSSSERLHKLIHPDADSSDHHCAITMLVQGQVSTPETLLVLAAFVSLLLFALPPLGAVVFSSFDYRFSSSRAPPLA